MQGALDCVVVWSNISVQESLSHHDTRQFSVSIQTLSFILLLLLKFYE